MDLAELARAIAIGLVLGVATGVPLGVVNVAVIELAARDRRAATWLGIGGALADGVHTTIAVVGYGAVVAASPTATRALAIASAAIVIGYAVVIVRRADRRAAAPAAARLAGSRRRALATGLALTLPNPGALLAWTAVAAAVFPRATWAVALAAAGAVAVGSAAWFAALARLAARVRLDERRWAARAVALVLLALACVAVIRTVARA